MGLSKKTDASLPRMDAEERSHMLVRIGTSGGLTGKSDPQGVSAAIEFMATLRFNFCNKSISTC
jgi:hypothetical protein